MKYDEYACAVIAKQAQKPRWRFGQVCFNVLSDVAPALADEVRGTVLDPFHNDERVEPFLGWVCEQLTSGEASC